MTLNDPLENHLYLTRKQKDLLKKSGLNTVGDLLKYYPVNYKKFIELKSIKDLRPKEESRIRAKVLGSESKRAWKRKMSVVESVVQDDTGLLKIVWFNQPYMKDILRAGNYYFFSGKISQGKSGRKMINPIWEESAENLDSKEKIYPIYPSIYGLSSRWLGSKIKKLLGLLPRDIKDNLPEHIRKKYYLAGLKASLLAIHQPGDLRRAEAARKRLSFEEIFFLQLSRLKEKIIRKKMPSFKIKTSKEEISAFIKSLKFKLTGAQQRAVQAILKDLGKPEPMARLLEGDVGSGKTAVAAIISFALFKSGHQVAYMAPTEVLARQIYEEFINFLKPYRPKIGLLTSSQSRKFPSKAFPNKDAKISKNQILKWVLSGEIKILIGTHSLTYEKVKFNKLGLVIIDEQHRFGIKQRGLLAKKTSKELPAIPHLLSMTATPIPRTLALTIYGDLDLTLLDEMPPGRKKIKTIIVPPEQRKRAYEMMRKEIKKGRQAYVICPRIGDQNEAGGNLANENEQGGEISAIPTETIEQEEIKTVKNERKRLSKDIFPEFKIGMLHGKMLPKEKEEVIKKFKNNEYQILVSTSVIEVGVSIPNATIILIEGAERFGLAQLHQLRGRVLRSIHQPYAFIFTDYSSKKITDRLKALTESRNGFELAEYDLKFRGPGELSGTKQWGVSDLAMLGLKNLKMVESARKEAQDILERDPELKNFPELKESLQAFSSDSVHLE